ncbi:MAG TPA: M20/M25/M40 family metallo-hydrolase [Bryobacteraceae bacterium]|jgi:acetylornithine deacetylase/succinyl-diaminopimelate desuccinylase-like protein
MRRVCAVLCLTAVACAGDDNRSLGDRTRQYLTDLVRLDTSNPPGHESAAATYLKQVADSFGIPAELMGTPNRMNFVARLKGNGKGRPLLLMAHSDVWPADPKQWSSDPFGAQVRDGFLYGRGTLDAKGLLAAELSVMVEIKRRKLNLNRDLILVSEADHEVGMSGIQWLIQNAWGKIDAEFALNTGSSIRETKDGSKIFEVQVAEKVPMRVLLSARGSFGTGAVPRPDNPIVHLSRAVTRLSEADQPIVFNATTRRYLTDLSMLADYNWLAPLIPKLDNPATALATAGQIRMRDPELDALLHTTVSVPANTELDVRRMPSESRDEVLTRLRQIVNDSAVELTIGPGVVPPATEPSPRRMSPLYTAMQRAIARIYPHDAVVTPTMSRATTDASFLRARGMPVYGVPVFVREPGESKVHSVDERISLKSLDDGVELLWQMVLEAAGEN